MTTRTVLSALAPAALVSALGAAPAFADDAAAAPALTAEQAAEVRDIVKEVLADADSRASLADGATAGIDKNGKIFLKSEDGKYDINLYGRVQTRFIYNNCANNGGLSNAAKGDHNDAGFEVRRVNLGWKGHVGEGVSYLVELETRQPGISDNYAMALALGYADWEVMEGFTVRGGKFYTPYTREAMISPYYQVAVDRSIVGNFFALNKTQGVQLEYTDKEYFKARAALDNGGGNEGNQWNNGSNQYAVQGRLDFLPVGSFADMNDNLAMAEEDKQSLLLGVGGYFQKASNFTAPTPTPTTGFSIPTTNTTTIYGGGVGANNRIDSSWGLTADATWKVANFSFFGAGYLAHAAPVNVAGGRVATPWGLEGEVEYRIAKPYSVFVQYNYINTDVSSSYGVNTKDFNAVVVGGNYFINRNLKLTGDVVYVLTGGNPTSIGSIPGGALGSGAGLVNNTTATHDAAGQVAARVQLQINF